MPPTVPANQGWNCACPQVLSKVKAVPALKSLSDNDTFLLGNQDVYLEKFRVFKAGLRPNTLAWHNKIGHAVLFCWFLELP